MRYLTRGLIAAACMGALAPSEVLAQAQAVPEPVKQQRRSMVSVFGLGWYRLGPGAGVRYTLPLLHEGLLPVDDSFELELGGDVWFGALGYRGSEYTGVGIPVEGRWTFHLSPEFSAYAKLSVGWQFNLWNGTVQGSHSGLANNGPYWDGQVGVLYHLGDMVTLRAEGGAAGVRAGVGLRF